MTISDNEHPDGPRRRRPVSYVDPVDGPQGERPDDYPEERGHDLCDLDDCPCFKAGADARAHSIGDSVLTLREMANHLERYYGVDAAERPSGAVSGAVTGPDDLLVPRDLLNRLIGIAMALEAPNEHAFVHRAIGDALEALVAGRVA